MPKSSIIQTHDLYSALAQYIAERPDQANSWIHWPSFAYCFADALAAVSEHDLLDVLDVFVQAGWLTEEPTGYRISLKAKQEARSGGMPQRR